jgi:hypothetical protein
MSALILEIIQNARSIIWMLFKYGNVVQIFGTIKKNSSSNKPKVTIPKPGDKML